MELQEKVERAFLPQGPLSSAAGHFLPRAGQTQMALAVARTIEQGGVLVVEAGTGVGKTFAYLVPALFSGERVLLSTATKTLQDQLFRRDLPSLATALGLPLRTALLKGRGNYICLHRLEMACHSGALSDLERASRLTRIARWAARTVSGDLAELPELDDQSDLIPDITSTRENCLGGQCPKLQACHVILARRDALEADVIVINHHLFFADLTVREAGMAELLPAVKVVIFDEAHQLNETGVQFLGHQLSTGQMQDFARDLISVGSQRARGFADWEGLGEAVFGAADALRSRLSRGGSSGLRLGWTDDSSEGRAVKLSLVEVANAFSQCAGVLGTLHELTPELVRLHERSLEILQRCEAFALDCEPGEVRWIDLGAQVKLVQAPLDIATAVQARMLNPDSEESLGRAWIFTSATLGADQALTRFTEPCGLSLATILKVESPFDYASQASVYVPRHLALPSHADHSAQVASFACAAARTLSGRTLVLTTTLRAMRRIGELLRRELAGANVEVLVQGELPKRQLMERFRSVDGAQPGRFILVASASFWEGIDVPGHALQLVIIDKLPFPPPNDPLVDARSQRLQSEGRSAFRDYLLPEACLALKQGAGRLIRRETDRGILVVCDTRLVTKGYGRRIMAALPLMRQIGTEDEFQLALDLLTRASTMASIPS